MKSIKSCRDEMCEAMEKRYLETGKIRIIGRNGWEMEGNLSSMIPVFRTFNFHIYSRFFIILTFHTIPHIHESNVFDIFKLCNMLEMLWQCLPNSFQYLKKYSMRISIVYYIYW